MKQLCISKVAAMGKQNTVLEYHSDRRYIIYSFSNTANSGVYSYSGWKAAEVKQYGMVFSEYSCRKAFHSAKKGLESAHDSLKLTQCLCDLASRVLLFFLLQNYSSPWPFLLQKGQVPYQELLCTKIWALPWNKEAQLN